MSDSYLLFSEHELIFFTDGSKSDCGTGCSVIAIEPMSHNVKANKFKLRKDNAIFQAETIAIFQVLLYLLTIPIMKLSTITKNVLSVFRLGFFDILRFGGEGWIIFVVCGPISAKFCTGIDNQSISSNMEKYCIKLMTS